VAAEWLHRERQRLEAYTRSQLARIEQEHQAMVQQNYLNEQGLIFRAQELSRREEVLQAQGRGLQDQHRELARREQALAGQLQHWWEANEQLALLQEVNQTTREDTERMKSLRGALAGETAALQQAREAAAGELRNLLQAVEAAQQTRQKEEAVLKEQKTMLEQRIRQAERAAMASEQRQAELDDLEDRLRRELEEQEQDLRRRTRELQTREQGLCGTLARLRASQMSLEQRMAEADRETAANTRRAAELDEWQEGLDRASEEMERYYREMDNRDWQWSERGPQVPPGQETPRPRQPPLCGVARHLPEALLSLRAVRRKAQR